jgi:hypothetical protein
MGGSTTGSAWGYRLMPHNTSNFTDWTFNVSLHSLSPDVTAPPKPTTLTLTINGATAGDPKSALVSAMGSVTLSWTALDLSSHATDTASVVELVVSTTGSIAMPLKLDVHLGDWGCFPSYTTPAVGICH